MLVRVSVRSRAPRRSLAIGIALLAIADACTLSGCAGPAATPEPLDASLRVLRERQRPAAAASSDSDEGGSAAPPAAAPGVGSQTRLQRAAQLLAGDDPPAGERLLREELATGPQSTEAALVLVDLCTAREEFDAALAAIEAALARAPDAPVLVLAKARLLFDLAQPVQAAELLAPLATRPDVHPRLLFELAQAERTRLRFDAALLHLGVLLGQLATHEWVQQHGVELTSLQREVEAERAAGRRRSVEARELLAVLRGAASTQARLRALEELTRESGALADAALRIAAADREPLLRQEALRRRCRDGQVASVCIRAGLDDPAGTVRGTAAALAAASLPQAEAVALLLAALDREADDYAFGRLHEALCRLHGERIRLPAGELGEEQRRELRRQWRQRWLR